MTSGVKKNIVCDYCQTEKEPNIIYTAKKVFAGRKIIDLLQIVAQRSLPASLCIKICNVCASSLMSTTPIVEKTILLIEKSLVTKKSPALVQNRKEVDHDQDLPLEVINLEEETVIKEDQLEKKKPQSKKKPETNKPKDYTPASTASPKKSISGTVNQDSPSKKSTAAVIPSSPKKSGVTSQKVVISKNKSMPVDKDAEDDLEDAVKLTQSNAVAKKNNSLIQLFGPSKTAVANVSESEDEEPERETAAKKLKSDIQVQKFDCKLCDFESKTAKPLKDHLKLVHNQQRPRIFFCSECTKSFGLLKTLKQHLVTHDIPIEPAKATTEAKKKIVEPKPTKSPAVEPLPTLAVLTALNGPVVVQPEVNANPEYTFQINGESASTPKPIEKRRMSMQFLCDVCDSEVQTVKLMQEHMKTAHQVEKPKIFKCTTCDRQFSTKQNLDHHSLKHNETESNLNKSSVNLQTSGIAKDKSKNSSINTKSKKSFENNAEEEKMESSKKGKKKLETSLKKKTDEIKKSPIKKPENVIDLNSTEISLLSNDEDTLNITVKKSPLKKVKPKSPKIIVVETIAPPKDDGSPNKSVKRKTDDDKANVSLKSKKSKINTSTVVSNDVDENPEEVNHKVKPHKKTRLESFVYSETDEDDYLCTECNKLVTSRKRLQSHIQKKHGKSFMCPICISVYANPSNYVAHFELCEAPKGLPCGKKNCTKVFQDDEYLLSHLKKHEKNDP